MRIEFSDSLGKGGLSRSKRILSILDASPPFNVGDLSVS